MKSCQHRSGNADPCPANKLTGSATGPEDAVEANMIRQSMINNWLHGFAQIMKRMWAMDRAHNSEVWFRYQTIHKV